MFYKLLNRNLLSAILTSAIVLGASSKSFAQSVVTLVEGDDLFPAQQMKAPAAEKTVSNEKASAATGATIPLDDSALLTPPPANTKPVVAAPAENFDDDAEFSLELEPVSAPLPSAPVAPMAAPVAAQNAPVAAPQPAAPVSEPQFGSSLLSTIDNDLFNQMSDIEKQTTLLTLELRREKLRNELEAVKEQRSKAREEKLALEEEKRRKEAEWKADQEAKVLREQQALKEKEILLERLKQKKVLNSYMNQMLEQNQKWIAENGKLYQKMREVEADRKRISDDFKKKLEDLTAVSNKTIQAANEAKANHDRTIANLTAQNLQLKKRLEAEVLAAKNREQNPFAGADKENASDKNKAESAIDVQIAPIAVAKEYAILDISGKGDELTAKLINKDGKSFQVRPGTVLQTGHTVEAIAKNYIQFDRNGLKDYLYTNTTASGVETEMMDGASQEVKPKNQAKNRKPATRSGNLSNSVGIPSLGSGMFVK